LVTAAAGYYKISVSYVSGGSLFSNNEKISVNFSRTGDLGSQGAQGAQGAPGASVTGAQGAQGSVGSQGAQGATGAQGASSTIADSVLTVETTQNATFYPTFVDSNNPAPGEQEKIYTDTGLSYNPLTNILDVTGRIENGDGSVSTPAYSFINDTNTGVYRITTDTLGFATNGNRRMSVASNIVNLGAGSDGSLNYDLEGGVTTSNATPATLLTISTVSGLYYTVEAWVIGGTGTNAIGGKSYAVFKNVAGTLTQVGTTDNTFQKEDFGGTPSFTMDASGTTIRIRVTGLAATTIEWYGKFVYQTINTAA